MKLGLVARADDRGIGTLTWEFSRAMTPERTLVVREPGAERRGFTPHVERYPDALVVHYDDGQLSERACREFLDGLDVVYLVETSYDPRFYEWARDAGCVTVLHAMPEFWRWHEQTERPDVWWLPTSWRADELPAECRVVEVPVPESDVMSVSDDAVFVHVAGHRAVGDRNGTLLLYQALRFVRRQMTVRLFTQDAQLPRVRSRSNVDLQIESGGVADRWALYEDSSVLVLPRRYGGLCLPALEAIACGHALVMSDTEPQSSTWPALLVPTQRGREIAMPCGPLKLADVSPAALARRLDRLVEHREQLDELRARSRCFADAHGWRRLAGLYRQELTRAVVTRGRR